MRSKIRRRVLFFVFSALIVCGLCIGVFADSYDDSRVGSYYYESPYDLGSVYGHFYSGETNTLPIGYYYFMVITNDDFASVTVNGDLLVFSNFIIGEHAGELYYRPIISSNMYYDPTIINPDSDIVYIFYKVEELVSIKFSGSGELYIYHVNDSQDIDIYDNSQDVWASVVSVVDDVTDSIINNDLLLLFAAAVPIISFGVGFLIRLKYRG